MMRFLTLLFYITISCFLINPVSAQMDDTGIEIDTPDRKPMPNSWYINGGVMHFGSDVTGVRLSGWSAGLGYQFYLSNPVFMRFGLFYGVDSDVDNKAISSKTYGMNDVLEGLGYNSFVRNYSTSTFGLQAKMGWDFINTYAGDGKKKFSIYAIGGIELLYYTARYDALDENGNRYDFSVIDFEADDTEDQLDGLLDGEYETDAPDAGQLGIGLNLGLGFRYQVSDGFGFGLEHQTGITFTDKLDGFVSADNDDSVNHSRLFLYFSF